MGLAEDLIATANSILSEFAPPDRKVYKRTIVRTGLDELIGRSSVVSVTDTLLSPQPYYVRIDTSNEGVLSSNKNVNIGDYIFILSVDALSRAEIQNKDIVLVLKDSSANAEVFRLLDYENPSVENTEVLYVGYYRSIVRP